MIALLCVCIYIKLLYQLTEDKAGLYSHIAHSPEECEWTVDVLHRSSQPRGQVGADIQATLSQAISLVLGLSSSQRKDLLFTYVYFFK